MLVIPAIDIREGKCVRLRQGDFSQVTIYNDDPAAVARDFFAQGAELLHVVDLDAAQSGQLTNLDSLSKILNAVSIPVQFGGGLRDIDAVRRVLSLGVDRVVLGSVAHNDLNLMERLCVEFGDKIIGAVDARAGRVAIHGWCEDTATPVLEAVKRLRDVGVEEMIYTDIARDGMLGGPDFSGLKDILAMGVKVIASGGISSLADLSSVLTLSSLGVTGVIVGKAIYSGAFTLKDAIKSVGQESERGDRSCLEKE